MAEKFDLVVIGSGPAGEKGATQAAYFGYRVAIVERSDALGGSPVSTAGIPTKTLRETALYVTGFQQRDVYGLSLQLDPEATLERLMSRTEEVISTSQDRVRRNIERHSIALYRGTATLRPGHRVVVNSNDRETALEANAVLVATGSRPFRPSGIPFDDPDVHDSEDIIRTDRIPKTLVVVGGGPVGCEFASIFTALGVDVTLVDSAERLLPFMDAEISALLAHAFRGMGARMVLGSGVATIERVGGELRVSLADGEVLRPDKVLFAAGRAGNTENLGLEAAGVDVDARGRILVDRQFRTTAEGIYAAGDVIGPPALASVSTEQGRVAVCHALGIPFKATVDPLAPFGIYSIPEVAMVGLTEEVAKDRSIDYDVGRGWFTDNTRANIAGSTEGLLKLVFRRDDKTLLGVHILGDIAGELIHQGQAVLHSGGTIDRFIHATFNVPTRSDAYKYAAYDGLQRLAGRAVGADSAVVR
ncbi:MAG: Si-specific NAD(P)(+) transhydrogenase [Actinomycetota bacterium]|nr:Si-specific NAD(P)(+) transhydrogenase [Actinomycetota bacterium]